MEGCIMIQKKQIFFEIFKILRTEKLMSQGQIIERLVRMGYKRTTCQVLFKPSVLQPVFVKDEDGNFDFAEPLVKKVHLPSETRAHFQLNKKWLTVGEQDAENKLFGLD